MAFSLRVNGLSAYFFHCAGAKRVLAPHALLAAAIVARARKKANARRVKKYAPFFAVWIRLRRNLLRGRSFPAG
jgi:hypothetical protein